MRVNFEVNTHFVSEILQDNKKRLNIFFYNVHQTSKHSHTVSTE